MRKYLSVKVVAGLLFATPCIAEDTNGYQAILTGNLAQAEQELIAQRREYPARPELMLNLAYVYAKTARSEQARALYREVLARRDVAMDLPDGSVVTSHALADTGLSRLSGTTLAVR